MPSSYSRKAERTEYAAGQFHPRAEAPSEFVSASNPRRQRDGGYLLLAILLMMAFMVIAATVEAPRMVQQIKRDREEEMIHRGTEYARAIKKFYKKFGRYPATLEQLDNTNQIRFLRKRYKDPLTKDGKWKLLNYGDIQSLLNPQRPGNAGGRVGRARARHIRAAQLRHVHGTSGAAGLQGAPTAGNIIYNSTTGFDQNNQPPQQQQQQQQQTGGVGGQPGTRPRAISKATACSATPSAWDPAAQPTPTSQEARRAVRAAQRWGRTRRAARPSAEEPSSALPA